MGDMADDIIDGIFCEQCGGYLGNAVGYPRICSSCSGDDEDEERDFDTKDDLIAEGYNGEI